MLTSATTPAASQVLLPDRTISRVNFGSCLHQDLPAPIFEDILKEPPDLFLFLGDNIYSWSNDIKERERVYQSLIRSKHLTALLTASSVLATWDDNDYGEIDGGTNYRFRAESKALFLRAFPAPQVPDPRLSHEGVYYSVIFGTIGRRLQVILLDTRSFRTPLLNRSASATPSVSARCLGPYRPNSSTEATILGDEQWRWLEAQLKLPAEIRLLISSIQVISDEHCYESWGNFPLERKRLFDLLGDTTSGELMILSGDRHHGELSKIEGMTSSPLFDFTSSSLNQRHGEGAEENRYRVGQQVIESNVGAINIDWNSNPLSVTFQLKGPGGISYDKHTLSIKPTHSHSPESSSGGTQQHER